MGSDGRRRISWKLLRVLAVGVLILGGSAWLRVRSVETRRWRHLEGRLAELHQEIETRNGPRPVLRGVAAPGNAWDDYLRAVEIARGGLDHLKISAVVNRSPGADPAAVRLTLSKFEAALEFLRKGTRRAELRRARIQVGSLSTTKDSPLYVLHDLSLLTVCRARVLAEQGDVAGAVEDLLDLCQLGHDLSLDGSLLAEVYGTVAYGMALAELKELICAGKLTPSLCGQLDQELGVLDASFPNHDASLLGELEFLGEILLKEEFYHYYSSVNRPPRPSDLMSWRYAYSPRLMQVAAFDQEDVWVRRLREATGRSWVDEQKAWGEIQAEEKRVANVVIAYFHQTGQGPWIAHRERMSQLRILRTAAHYLAAGEILELVDPFGITLRHSMPTPNGHLKIWSVGRNGKDDGGSGDWKASSPDDIVLEVSR